MPLAKDDVYNNASIAAACTGMYSSWEHYREEGGAHQYHFHQGTIWLTPMRKPANRFQKL